MKKPWVGCPWRILLHRDRAMFAICSCDTDKNHHRAQKVLQFKCGDFWSLVSCNLWRFSKNRQRNQIYTVRINTTVRGWNGPSVSSSQLCMFFLGKVCLYSFNINARFRFRHRFSGRQAWLSVWQFWFLLQFPEKRVWQFQFSFWLGSCADLLTRSHREVSNGVGADGSEWSYPICILDNVFQSI